MGGMFEEIKARVKITDVVIHYGYQPNRAGFICCPLHGEKTPSLKLYVDSNSWHCFGCHKGGDAVAFVSELFGLRPLDAARKLNTDYGLGLALDGHKPTAAERRAAERRQKVSAAAAFFENWRDATLRDLCAAFRTGEAALARGPDSWTATETAAVMERERIDYFIELLSGDSTEDMMDVFRQRVEVKALCAKILKHTPTRS